MESMSITACYNSAIMGPWHENIGNPVMWNAPSAASGFPRKAWLAILDGNTSTSQVHWRKQWIGKTLSSQSPSWRS